MRDRRAVTLIELMVGMSLVLVLTGVAFSLFQVSTDAFRISLMRQDLQTAARQILGRLEQELRVTSLESLSVGDAPIRSQTVDGAQARRHMLCMASISDWNDLSLYDANTGSPLWNRYVLYYATLETPNAHLFRLELDPASSASVPWTSFATLVPPDQLPTSPFAGASVTRKQVLSADVFEFTVIPDDKALRCSLKLRRQESARMGGIKARDEVFQLEIEARPRN